MRKITKYGSVYLEVDQNEKGEILCPYCGQIHTHGRGSGHRVAHCDPCTYYSDVEVDGHVFKTSNGYYLKYSK